MAQHEMECVLQKEVIYMADYSEKVKQAIGFATKKHEGTARKGTDIPYIDHSIEALEIASLLTDDEDVVCAAVLHDVVEDAGVTVNELQKLFGERVALFVSDESENKRENLSPESTWKIRKKETIIHFLHASREAKIIALGDKLSNMRAIHRDYDSVGDKLWERFNCKDKSEQGWYYSLLTKALSELSDTDAWKELNEHVNAVFGNGEQPEIGIGEKVEIVGLEYYDGLSGAVTGYNRSEYLVGIDCPDDGSIELENIDDWGGALLPKLVEVDAKYHGLRHLSVTHIDGHKFIEAKASGGVLSMRISKKYLVKII